MYRLSESDKAHLQVRDRADSGAVVEPPCLLAYTLPLRQHLDRQGLALHLKHVHQEQSARWAPPPQVEAGRADRLRRRSAQRPAPRKAHAPVMLLALFRKLTLL